MPVPHLPAAASSPGRDAGPGATGTVGEALAIAPDTYVVPGWWSSRADRPGIPVGTLVVRGPTGAAVVDTAPAPLGSDWLAAVLALVDPDHVRWIVATGRDPARTGCLGALVTACPRATVVLPGAGRGPIDLGDDVELLLHEGTPPATADAWCQTPGVRAPVAGPGRLAVELVRHRLLWTDIVGGTAPAICPEATGWGDDDLLSLMATRARPLRVDELTRAEALDLRVLAGPNGPVARGRTGVARALRLAEDAEALRTVRSGRAVAALHEALGPEAWTTGGTIPA